MIPNIPLEFYEMNNYQNELGENVSSNKEINNIRKAVREKYKMNLPWK